MDRPSDAPCFFWMCLALEIHEKHRSRFDLWCRTRGHTARIGVTIPGGYGTLDGSSSPIPMPERSTMTARAVDNRSRSSGVLLIYRSMSWGRLFACVRRSLLLGLLAEPGTWSRTRITSPRLIRRDSLSSNARVFFPARRNSKR